MSEDLADIAEQLELAGASLIFAEHLAQHRDPDAAAMHAGYSKGAARVAALSFLRDPSVTAYVQARARSLTADVASRSDIVRGELVAALWGVYERATREHAVINKRGEETGETRFDSNGANRALELLAKIGGHLQADKGSGSVSPVSVEFTFQITADPESQIGAGKVIDLVPDSDEDEEDNGA